MKYKAGNRRRAAEYERAILAWWEKEKIFEQSVSARDEARSYVFYDGPPFITGLPHHGTLLSSIAKDAVPRFWTMRGFRVERRWGWDCHGLPAENFVEKQLGITDRRVIGAGADVAGAVSLADYIMKARESMIANSEAWEGTIKRVGRWVDFRGAYRTMDKDFMESVWWAFKTLYEKGKIYEGRKVLMYDTKFATPVSKAEVTMDGDAYQVVTDPSAYVKFSLTPSASVDALFTRRMSNTPRSVAPTSLNSSNENLTPVYLLAWTTTPWTLPANMALAVSPKMRYVCVETADGEKLVLAKSLLEKVLAGVEYEVIRDDIMGKDLEGLKYEPLVDLAGAPGVEMEKDSHTVRVADFVSDTDGTGIVHIAPAYGEDDYDLSLKYEVGFADVLDENGYYLPEVAEILRGLGVRDTDEHGIEIWAGNKFIAKCLEEKGIVWKIEYIQHEYPFNPRSKQRIMYRAFPSWFFDIAGSKPLMLEENEKINWFPEHLKHGRFEKNIEQAPDWNLSRDRFWATAMPVWKGDKGTVKVVGSYEELYELSGVKLEDYHRPWVDEIEFEIDGEKFKRIDKVLDCWFESGSMPFAQLHYPFENKEKFERNYPADYIVEYVGQVRAWFYYIHAVNTALFGKNAFSNVITTGTLAGNDGRKMSKSLGNYTDPNELMDKFSADSLRFLLLSSPVMAGEDFALLDKDVSDVARKLSMIWNVYDFFCMYAEVDKIDSDELAKSFSGEVSTLKNPLDKWIVSRVHQLRDEITKGMETYNLPKALEGALPFVDDLSNWFVRRSRRRFWKSEDDTDKMEAYSTLYYVLVYLSKIIAPFVPFLAEELYKNMTGDEGSVHLLDWPEAGEVDEGVIADMRTVREVITEGLAQRMNKEDGQIKVRQPLSELVYGGEKLDEFYEGIIAEEVNVKKVVHGSVTKLNKEITPELQREGFARELIRVVQAGRKKAGLEVADRIKLSVSVEVPEEYAEMVKEEVLAVEMNQEGNYKYDEIVKVNGENVTISLEKA